MVVPSFLVGIYCVMSQFTSNSLIDAYPSSRDTAKLSRQGARFGYQNVLVSAPRKSPEVGHLPEEVKLYKLDSSLSSEEEITTTPTFLPLQDYDYDEESLEDLNESDRSVLCPNTTSQFRYDEIFKTCSEARTQGHCGTNMVFHINNTNTLHGFCECDFQNSTSPLVYHNASNSCYPIYTQAFCRSNEWLTFTDNLEPVCELRSCKKQGKITQVPLNGSGPCVALDAASNYCETNETVQFPPEVLVPMCYRQMNEMMPRVLAPVVKFRCPPGSYRSITKKCKTGWNWSK